MSSFDVSPTERPAASGSNVRTTRDSSAPSERTGASERSYLSVFPARRVSLSQPASTPHRVQHGELSTRQSNTMLIAFDERHAPIFVTTFEGRLDLDAVVWHDAVATKAIQAALSQGRRVIHVVDARRVEVPNAQLRKHWATRLQQTVGTLESMLGNFVVIDSPLLRGALTAIDWLSHEGRRIEYFSTLSDAVAVANLRLAAVGSTLAPFDATNYRGTLLERANNKPATGTA